MVTRQDYRALLGEPDMRVLLTLNEIAEEVGSDG